MALNEFKFPFQKEIGTLQLIDEIETVLGPSKPFTYHKNMLPKPEGVFATELFLRFVDPITLTPTEESDIAQAIVVHNPTPTDAVLRTQRRTADDVALQQFRTDFAAFELSFIADPNDLAKLKANQLAIKDIFASFARLVYPYI